MASSTYLGYGNVALATPLATSGVANAELLASSIVGRKAVLATSARADFGFDATAGIRLVGVDGLELRSGGTPSIRFALSNTVIGGSELGVHTFSPILTPGYQTQAWVLPAALTTAQFLRVNFTNCAAVGIVWCSPVLNPECGIEVGMSRRWNDLSVVTQSELTGAETVMRRPMYRSVGIRFGAIEDDDFAAFDDAVMASGTHGQVMLVPGLADGRRNRDIIHGRFVNLADETHIAPALMAWPFEIRQSL